MSVWAGESIHNAVLSQLASAPIGKKITKLSFTWNADGTVQTLKAYQGEELLFTLTFTYSSGNLQDITRS
jgi:hypothetical protein